VARGRIAQESWAWGEVAPELGGAYRLDQFKASAQILENFQVLELPVFTRRAGTRFVGEAKFSDRLAALIPFTFSQGQSYLLEVGDGYIRFYRNRARIPVEIVSPYAAADVRTIKTAQSADVLYLAHPKYAPQVLERYSDMIWRTRPITNVLGGHPAPSFEYGTRPPIGCTMSTDSPVMGPATITAALPIFLASDVAPVGSGAVAREILVFDGVNAGARATITAIISPTQATVQITQPFASLAVVAADDWKITGSPLAVLTPSGIGPVGTIVTLTLDRAGWRAPTAGMMVHLNGGTLELGTEPVFSDTVVPAVIRSEMTGTVAAASQPGAWTLEEPAWSDLNGYPAALVFFQGRLWLGGSFAQPDTLWGSKSEDFENFAVGVLADDAIQVSLVASQVNQIVWLAATDKLLAGTSGEIFAIGGGTNDVLTPTNVQATPAVAYGARKETSPLGIGPALLFPTVSGLKLREMIFDLYTNRFLAPNLLLLAKHLTAPTMTRLSRTARGLLRIAYQREPLETLWAATEDGRWLGATYLRDQNIVAWSPYPTQGTLLDIAVIPKEDGTGDETWLLMQRVVGGITKVFLEVVDDQGLVYDRLFTDCASTVDGLGRVVLTPAGAVMVGGSAVTFTAAAAAFVAGDLGRQIWQADGGPGQAQITTVDSPTLIHATVIEPFSSAAPMVAGAWGIARQHVDGLLHLEGATVKVVGDGYPQNDKVVAGGAIDADTPAIAFEVGLGYVSTFKSQRPAIEGHQGQPTFQPQIRLRFLNTLGAKVNGKRFTQFPQTGLFTGDITENVLTGSGDGAITITQEDPLPCTVIYAQALTQVSQG
jgi:hypothetical protein